MESQNVLLSGSHGLIGSALQSGLQAAGHRVVPLVRSSDEKGILWNPRQGIEDLPSCQGFTAVVHLAGVNVSARRWSEGYKQEILDSRVAATRQLVEQLQQFIPRPRVLLCASAAGYYGDHGDEIVTEQSAAGHTFLARVCKEWEEAAQQASHYGIRVVNMRFGMVLSSQGGALGQLLGPYRMGLGGRLGSGQQYWSWVAIPDLVSAVLHLLNSSDLVGPVNVTSPQPVRQIEFARTLAAQLDRPMLLSMPAPVARLILGEMVDEVLLPSCRAVPQYLTQSGFQFQYPELAGCLKSLLTSSLVA